LYAAYIYNNTPLNHVCLQMFSMVLWFHIIILKTCMFGVALNLFSIISFNRDKSYLDGRLILKRECLWVAAEFMLVMFLWFLICILEPLRLNFIFYLTILFQPFPRLLERVKMLKNFFPIIGEKLCLANSTSIPCDNSSKILQDYWLNAEETLNKGK